MNRIFFLTIALLLARPTLADDNAKSFARDVEPFLKKHCYACHGPDKQESQVRYDRLDRYVIDQQHLWTSVHERLSEGEMPPEDEPQPTDAEKKVILEWIETQAAAARESLGSGSLRRLNRRELSAALQDLTGLHVDYAGGLPGDGTVDGFDTGAEALQDAADSIAQVMRVSGRAVEGIRFLEPPRGQVLSRDFREVKDPRKALDDWKELGIQAKIRGTIDPEAGLLIEPKWVGERGSLDIYVPPPTDGRGILRVKIAVSVVKYFDDVPNPNLWIEIGAKDIDKREVTALADKPLELQYEVQLADVAVESKGIRISLDNKVELPYGVKGFENEDKTGGKVPSGPGLFRPLYDRKKAPLEERPIPFIALRSIEIATDHTVPWPPVEWETGIEEITDDQASARELLEVWMDRAYRRPIAVEEVDRFFQLYQSLRQQGMPFDESLRATFQSVLMSGPFRYLASPADSDKTIAQHAIASRLSFMLIGSPPDAELRELAAAGKLRDPKVLDAQVDRLIEDSRSERFVEPFVRQWLVMDQPITITMDYFEKQDFRFGRYLKDSMRKETYSYVARLLKENRPARELIDSDWTMMNNSLAVHYGYDDIEGGHLRKVTLRRDDPRGGGIMSHAGIQSMLCWMGENWVIYRGAWALRHILNDPPPPPPLEVPELIPSDGANQGKTFRELLKQHQEDEKCSICHKKMDPLGFAFQNFDISGRWRDQEFHKYKREELDGKIAWRGEGDSRPVDAAGQLPRGHKFTNYSEFKQMIIGEYMPDVVGGLLKNLMIYTTGRKPDVADMAEIREIIAAEAKQGYRMRDLVKAVVKSDAFLEH